MVEKVVGIPLISEMLLERMQRRERSSCPQLWDLLEDVKDPEIPVVSIWDLGILQDIERREDRVLVTITPTYSGCPAMHELKSDVCRVLRGAGYETVEVVLQLSPAWSTEMISFEGRKQLQAYGIAPPLSPRGSQLLLCPQCGSQQTERISEFGSTACKALYKCTDCLEPFDYFKCI